MDRSDRGPARRARRGGTGMSAETAARWVLRARDVVLSFGETPALRGADVSVAAGEIPAAMGPGGSGQAPPPPRLARHPFPDDWRGPFADHPRGTMTRD